MSSTPKITFFNELDDNDPVTFVIAERSSGAAVRLTVTPGGSVSHSVDEDSGPWDVSVMLSDDDIKGGGSVTATSTVFELPAELKLETGSGNVRFDFRAPDFRPRPDKPGKGAQSVLDLASSWTHVGEPQEGGLGGDLKFAMQPQDHDYWCWAAVTSSVATFYGQPKYTQCSLATWQFGGGSCDCCSKSFPKVCDKPYDTQLALTHVGNLGAASAGKLAFDALAKEIDAGHPVVLRLVWPGVNVSHVVAVTGYSGTKITVQDSGGTSPIVSDYDKFPANQPGAPEWNTTFITKPN